MKGHGDNLGSSKVIYSGNGRKVVLTDWDELMQYSNVSWGLMAIILPSLDTYKTFFEASLKINNTPQYKYV